MANVAEFKAEAIVCGILRAGSGDEERATIAIFKSIQHLGTVKK